MIIWKPPSGLTLVLKLYFPKDWNGCTKGNWNKNVDLAIYTDDLKMEGGTRYRGRNILYSATVFHYEALAVDRSSMILPGWKIRDKKIVICSRSSWKPSAKSVFAAREELEILSESNSVTKKDTNELEMNWRTADMRKNSWKSVTYRLPNIS